VAQKHVSGIHAVDRQTQSQVNGLYGDKQHHETPSIRNHIRAGAGGSAPDGSTAGAGSTGVWNAVRSSATRLWATVSGVYFSAGTYRFTVLADDGVHLWIDGSNLLINTFDRPDPARR
jgi:hypothetical protein